MPFNYKHQGTWRTLTQLHYKQGGVWRNVREAWYKQGGAWRRIFVSLVTPLPGGGVASDTIDPTIATAGWRFNTSGGVDRRVQAVYTANHSWHGAPAAGVGSNFWIRATLVSGTGPSGSALSTWIQLTADVEWRLSSSGNSTRQCTLTIEISTDGGATVATSGTYSIRATREANV